MRVQIHNEDCLPAMRRMKDNSIDAIITDPPYGTTACKWDSIIPLKPMWEQLNRIIKPNGAIVLFGSEPFSSALRMSNIKNYKYDWIWDKKVSSGFLNAKKQPLRRIENIIIFYKKQPTYNPQFKKRTESEIKTFKAKQSCNGVGTENYNKYDLIKTKKAENKYPVNIIFKNSKEKECNFKNRKHPTQKPIELMEYLIKTYTNENETVLDFTMGIGSTGVACINTNRKFIGIELDKDYFNAASKRLKQHQQQLTMKL